MTNNRIKSAIFWMLAIIITLGSAYYQRTTGPTYPKRGKIIINGNTIKYKFIRSEDTSKDAQVKIFAPDKKINGSLSYKRYKTNDEWMQKDMVRSGNFLLATIPTQPAAGKVLYKVSLKQGSETIELTQEPVIIRFKGAVPKGILLPHIFLMFFAMLFSTRAGLEALVHGKKTHMFTTITLILFILGGMLLGPVVQKYAFDAYWTGWPFGHDLTDNKTAVSLLFWIIAFFSVRKNPAKTRWVVIAAIILLAIYLIPHSLLGSELDYTQL